jgi:hypothetical protein
MYPKKLKIGSLSKTGYPGHALSLSSNTIIIITIIIINPLHYLAAPTRAAGMFIYILVIYSTGSAGTEVCGCVKGSLQSPLSLRDLQA